MGRVHCHNSPRYSPNNVYADAGTSVYSQHYITIGPELACYWPDMVHCWQNWLAQHAILFAHWHLIGPVTFTLSTQYRPMNIARADAGTSVLDHYSLPLFGTE